MSVDDEIFSAGDGVAMSDVASIEVTALEESELLLLSSSLLYLMKYIIQSLTTISNS